MPRLTCHDNRSTELENNHSSRFDDQPLKWPRLSRLGQKHPKVKWWKIRLSSPKSFLKSCPPWPRESYPKNSIKHDRERNIKLGSKRLRTRDEVSRMWLRSAWLLPWILFKAIALKGIAKDVNKWVDVRAEIFGSKTIRTLCFIMFKVIYTFVHNLIIELW